MSATWRSETVESCLQSIRLPRTKLPTSAYGSSGKYPIIDQGQTEIAGWTDDDDGLIDEELPVVVFGDHSRTLKYVDVPFVRGADGTQILKPRADIDPLFFFYALRSLNLESRGYNRHFKLLKEKLIPVPDLPAQVWIAQILGTVDRCLRLQSHQGLVLEELKWVAMEQFFRHGLLGEGQVDSQIGLVPESWVAEELGDSHLVQTGGTPSRSNPQFWDGGTIPWVKTGEVSYSTITKTSEHITPVALEESTVRLFPVGTLLLAMYEQGVTRGKVGKLGIEATCNQACAAINSLEGQVDADYLYYFLEWQYENIRARAHGGQQQNLNLDIVRRIPIVYPGDLDQQLEIAGLLRAIDMKIALQRARLERLRELFERVLGDAISGEIAPSEMASLVAESKGSAA